MEKTSLELFKNRRLVIATKHQKERVIAPVLEKALGVQPFVPESYDTDLFGTFTGELERKDDPLTTLRNKCLCAMEQFDCDLGIASEGSFGPHPSIFFAHADEELLLLIDKKNNLEIIARELSMHTNFNGEQLQSEDHLMDFAAQALFPTHALILRNAEAQHHKIVKGITDWTTLLRAYHEIRQEYGSVYAETDMRALYNPTRMQVIERAILQLVEKIHSQCPACGTPGFSVVEAIPGLPCNLCGAPTKSTRCHIYTCSSCLYRSEKLYPYDKFEEDPMYCDYCNP